MIFTYKKWNSFCQKLADSGFKCVTADSVNSSLKGYVVLKHDVETDVKKAYCLAQIEASHGIRGTYYVQAYLLDALENIKLLQQMQYMGHEISYHYDVMDSCKGDLEKAQEEFEKNKQKFESNGFVLKTLCQHGNPIVERIGYTSNRDFFRSKEICERYPELSDIMVNFKEKHDTDYVYFSDAGRKFKMIFDPINNDIVKSDDKNVPYDNLDKIFEVLDKDNNYFISTHPHRWTKSAVKYVLKTAVFKVVKFAAKIAVKVPFLKKFMSRYYYLAKKI